MTMDEDTIRRITPPGIDFLRRLSNHTVLDVLYFTSPRYCQSIIDSMTAQINATYAQFCELHPHFVSRGGRVSIVAHSLG